MRLGIIGLPNSGKTTLFNALTGGNYETSAVGGKQFHVNTAVVSVPDARLDVLEKMYEAKKKVFASITYSDIGGMDKGMGEGGLTGQLRNELSQVDGFVHVVRAFRSDTVPHPYETVNPQRDLEALDGEFLLMDLVSVEKRLERLTHELRVKGKKADGNVQDEIPLMEALKAHLEADKPLRDFEMTPEQRRLIGGFGFLSLKPVLIVLNQGDEIRPEDSQVSYAYSHAAHISIRAALEAEISQFSAEDAAMFMSEYGMTELSAGKVVALSYELVGIHSFLTAGEKEVRAWTIPLGASAFEAAGAIHGDIQKGFIRAEIIPYDALIEGGSEKAVKAAGKMRLESKDYVVQNGDIIVFRHNG